RARRRLHPEIPGDRDQRNLHALRSGVITPPRTRELPLPFGAREPPEQAARHVPHVDAIAPLWQVVGREGDANMEAAPQERRKSVAVDVGGVIVGGGAPVVVQSMTNTDTADVAATVAQVAVLARAGSELVRMNVVTA